MGEEALVETQIADAGALVAALDGLGFGPASALWHYFPDACQWRLLLGGRHFDELLPRAECRAYQQVAEALSASPVQSLTIAQVKLVRTDHALLQVARFLIRTPPDACIRAHFEDCVVNGMFIKAMVVLRST
jgi:hypothetical protein